MITKDGVTVAKEIGGGGALVRCIDKLDKLKPPGEEQIGINIVKRAMEEPLRQIAANAGEKGAIVLGKCANRRTPISDYNAQTGHFQDLVKAGVIDPTKVVRTALQNAGSIASLMLTKGALISEIPEEKPAAPARPVMDGMY